MPPSFAPAPMGYYRPSPTVKPTPLSPPKPIKIDSMAWSSMSYTTREPSTCHLKATLSTMDRSPTSTSLSAMGSTKKPSGYASMTMELSQGTVPHKGLTSSPTSSTSMPRPTLAPTPPLKLYRHGSGTCSLALAATFKYYKPQWPIPTTGGWPTKSHGTGRSMMISRPWQLSLRGTSATSTLHKPVSCHVSPISCSPALLNALSCSAMWPENPELYA